MTTKPAPKFKKMEKKAAPAKTEAEVLARSAEARTTGKPGRPTVEVPVKVVSISFPQDLLAAVDDYARQRTGKNRSMAVVELVTKALS